MEQGIVVEIHDNTILVETGMASWCGSCAVSHSCAIGNDGSKRRLWMDNDGGARVGDTVTFDITERAVILSSMTVYLLPVALLVAGILAGANVAELFDIERDLSSIAGGIAGLLVSVLIAWGMSRAMKKKSIFSPRLIDITHRDGTINCG